MEKCDYELVNKKRIFYIFSHAEKPSKQLVIMSHGFRGTNVGPARQFVDFQRLLNNEGFAVLRFDQPNSGNSEGDYNDSSFNEWIKTIVFFAEKYLNQGFEVSLMGQSMGATASVVATNDAKIKNKIPCILLWVPDPKSNVDLDPNEIDEEGGQKYKNSFWTEARDSQFFKCLEQFNGKIHLAYGEFDRFVDRDLMDKTIQIVKDKGQDVMILKRQDHSPWGYDLVQEVYKRDVEKLKE